MEGDAEEGQALVTRHTHSQEHQGAYWGGHRKPRHEASPLLPKRALMPHTPDQERVRTVCGVALQITSHVGSVEFFHN